MLCPAILRGRILLLSLRNSQTTGILCGQQDSGPSAESLCAFRYSVCKVLSKPAFRVTAHILLCPLNLPAIRSDYIAPSVVPPARVKFIKPLVILTVA
jgi:hypothetical protein